MFDQLEIIETPRGKKALSSAELIAFEDANKIILPLEYKNFCQVFGCGMFGEFVNIFCPNLNLVSYGEYTIESLKQDLRRFPAKDPKADEKIVDFLNNAFVFGNNIGSSLLSWDLRTYRKLDQSYDIYWIDINFISDDADVYRVGRDFFEFIRDFCLGKKAYEVLPEEYQPPLEFIYSTFEPISPLDL